MLCNLQPQLWNSWKRYSHPTLFYFRFLYVFVIFLCSFYWPQLILFYILANLSPDVVKNVPDELQTGIYFGWANVDNGEVYKAVLSLGWNPFFKNKEKSLVRTSQIIHHKMNITNLSWVHRLSILKLYPLLFHYLLLLFIYWILKDKID